MATTQQTVELECRMMSHATLDEILCSSHRKWRRYKVAAKREMVRRTKLYRGD